MQFIKKNYEKILLGIVLIGLVGVAVFLLFKVDNEKSAQEERRNKIINRPVKALPPPDLSQTDVLLKRAAAPVVLNLSDNTHKEFNPVRWQKASDGHLFKNPIGTDLEKLEITRIAPMYTIIALDSMTVSDSGARYVITVEQQAARLPGQRGKKPFYMSVGDKKEYNEKKDTLTLRAAHGETNNPSELILDLSDAPDKPVSIAKDKPFRRPDGYIADLKYTPDGRPFLGRRVGDRIILAGEEYNIVAITENEVVLSAKSNQKKWTIKYRAGQ